MKQTTYICNKCKQPIKGSVYRIFAGEVDVETDEIADESSFYMEEVGDADLCSNCLTQLDKELAKYCAFIDPTQVSSNSRGRRTVMLDMERVIELRNNGTSLADIAKEFGCSPQTVQNYLTRGNYYSTQEEITDDQICD